MQVVLIHSGAISTREPLIERYILGCLWETEISGTATCIVQRLSSFWRVHALSEVASYIHV